MGVCQGVDHAPNRPIVNPHSDLHTFSVIIATSGGGETGGQITFEEGSIPAARDSHSPAPGSVPADAGHDAKLLRTLHLRSTFY